MTFRGQSTANGETQKFTLVSVSDKTDKRRLWLTGVDTGRMPTVLAHAESGDGGR